MRDIPPGKTTAMRTSDSTQISGTLPLSFGQACVNFQFLIAEETPFLAQIKPDAWYPLQRFSKILNTIREKYSDPAPILEQIGIEMMNQWYSQGPGKQIIKKGIDFLHFQTSSEGYYSVIRGKPDQIGDFSLLSLDGEKGTAVVRSTTPFAKSVADNSCRSIPREALRRTTISTSFPWTYNWSRSSCRARCTARSNRVRISG